MAPYVMLVGREGEAMGNHKLTVDDGVLIGCNPWDIPIRVEVQAYLQFSRRLDDQLRRMVARWAHAASPMAREDICQERIGRHLRPR